MLASPARASETLWIEGESAGSHSFNKHSWYTKTDVRLDLLSPGKPSGAKGDWLAHFSNAGAGAQATYNFTATEGGEYTFWLRCNPFRTAAAYKLDGGAAKTIDLISDRREYLNLVNPKIDLRFVAWIKVGKVTLAKGAHTLTIVVSKDPGYDKGHAGIDALVFTNSAWTPAGATKPAKGAPTPGPADWFELRPDDDPHTKGALTDVSSLLHRPAGSQGQVTRKGAGLVTAKGQPIKFWGINATMAHNPTLMKQQARFYAKHGINLVRQHPVESAVGLLIGAGATRALDSKKLDTFDRWFAALKAEGIYMAFSPFFPHVITKADGYPDDLYKELPDDSKKSGKKTYGMVGFMPALQDAQWSWLSTLLAHKNPHTGLTYAADPALAIVEVHNEDSLFWNFPLNDLATGKKFPKHTAELQKLWMLWLKKRYADDAALAKAWGNGLRTGDSLKNPAMAIYGAWQMKGAGPTKAAEKQRMGDFIRFLADTQRKFYLKRIKRLRGIGYKGLTVTTAWRAGGAAADAANLWTDDAADVIDRHNYFGGGAGGHGIIEGTVDSQTHLDMPGRGLLSIGLYQVEDKPFTLSEWTQRPPNPYKAEAAPLVALYGMGLQGWDGVTHFAATRLRMGSGWPGLRSYVTATPHYLGQFPALAFAVHRGHIKEGPVMFARRLAEAAVFTGVDALKQDFTRGTDAKEPRSNPETPVEVLAIGRVTARIADGQKATEKGDWTRYWDKAAKTVTSATGELRWDYQQKLVLWLGKKSQGLIGFAGSKPHALPGVKVQVKTPFVSLLFTPLDDRPLTSSSQILITALARDRQAGSKYSADGKKLEKLGGPPLELEPVQATLTFTGAAVTSVRPLDMHGVPRGQQVERTGNTVTIDGRYASYYYEVRTSAPPPDGGGGTGAGDAGAAAGEDGGCGCRVGSAAGGGWILALFWIPIWIRRKDP